MGGYKKISKVTGTDIIIIVHTIFIIFGSVIVSIFFYQTDPSFRDVISQLQSQMFAMRTPHRIQIHNDTANI